MTEKHIGVDVSKDWLDIYHPDKGFSRVAVEAEALIAFARSVSQSGELVVFEATGGYDRPLVRALEEAGAAYCRVNPARARDFARACGVLGKTDRVDARCLAEMGRGLSLEPDAPLGAAGHALKTLTARRRQLVEMRKQEKTRLKQCDDAVVRASIEHLIEVFSEQIATIEAETTQLLDDAGLVDDATLIQSAPGVGPVVAATIIAELPELGRTDRRGIAALAGLAPVARDSGQRTAARHIRGGRPVLRSLLYIAALHASRLDERFRSFRNRLREKGKTAKQAIIAVARKLLTILNAMMKSQQPYQPISQ